MADLKESRLQEGEQIMKAWRNMPERIARLGVTEASKAFDYDDLISIVGAMAVWAESAGWKLTWKVN